MLQWSTGGECRSVIQAIVIVGTKNENNMHAWKILCVRGQRGREKHCDTKHRFAPLLVLSSLTWGLSFTSNKQDPLAAKYCSTHYYRGAT